ncbi:MAG: CapA family protein [Cytophagaceae bacterium]|nr:CapA family protein [Cytophagaceae bacterium]
MKSLFKYFFLFAIAGFYTGCKPSSTSDPAKSETTVIKDSLPVEKAITDSGINKVKETVKDTVVPAPVKMKRKDTISIIGVGDIMLGTTYPSDANYLAPDDGKFLLKPVEHILKNADITFGNHEGTLFNGIGTPKKCSDPTKCYSFKSPERYAQHLADAGFDLMSISNNHINDFGPEGRLSTYKSLKSVGLEAAGTLEVPFTTFMKDSIRYGLAAFSPNNGTIRMEDIQGAIRTVKYLDSICDIVIVSFHGGAEGISHQHITRKTEIFYGEDRGNVYEFTHKLIDAGADVIFGHGPHVTRALELYQGKIIAYSLGNFATYGRFNLKEENGIAPILKVYVDRKGNFIKGEITPIAQLGEGGPTIDESKKVIYKLKELTSIDFPETRLFIKDDGTIMVK